MENLISWAIAGVVLLFFFARHWRAHKRAEAQARAAAEHGPLFSDGPSAQHPQIQMDACIGCGLCRDERCQVNAIETADDVCRIIPERCIGCGLCIRTCPADAIGLLRKDPEKISTPPFTENDWFAERGHQRGVDFSAYK